MAPDRPSYSAAGGAGGNSSGEAGVVGGPGADSAPGGEASGEGVAGSVGAATAGQDLARPWPETAVGGERGEMDAGGEHLSPLTLARLRSGKLETEVIANKVVPHLLRHCPGCQQEAEREVQRLRLHVRHWDDVVVVSEGLEAPGLWQRLDALSHAEQLRAVETDASLRTWGLCRLVLARSWDAGAEGRPRRAAELANVAIWIARRLGGVYDPLWVRDLSAIAFAWLGNARRLLGELWSAGHAFDDARAACACGTGDPKILAQILAQEAVLRRDQRRLGEALELLARVDAILCAEGYEAAGAELEGMSGAEVALHQAWCRYHLGLTEAASKLLAAAADRLEESHAAALGPYLRCGEVWSAIALGRFEAAGTKLAAALAEPERLGQKELPVLLGWAQARIQLAAGDRDGAKRELHAAAQALVAQHHGIEGALAWFDLATLHLEDHEDEAIRNLADTILPAFSPAEVDRDQMATLLLFQQACREGRLTRELIAVLAAQLQEARRPSLAWWGSVLAAAEEAGDAGARGDA